MAKVWLRGKITEEQKQETLGRIRTTTNLEDLIRSDVVIEAVIENINVKKEVFQQAIECSRRM